MPWRQIIRFYALTTFATAVATLLIAWYNGTTTAREIADLSVMVSIGAAFLFLALLGPGRFAEGHRLEVDPRMNEVSSLGNRARGVVGLAGAATWAVVANLIAQMLR